MGILRPRPLLLFHVFFYLQIIFSYFLELYTEKFCIRFCLKTEFIFNGWSTVQTYPVKTVTVYAFKNASLNEFFFKCRFSVLVLAEEKGGFRKRLRHSVGYQ